MAYADLLNTDGTISMKAVMWMAHSKAKHDMETDAICSKRWPDHIPTTYAKCLAEQLRQAWDWARSMMEVSQRKVA